MYNNYNEYNPAVADERGLSAYISKVFGYMFLGLLITAAVAYYVASSENLVYAILSNYILFFGLMIGELALVAYLMGWITKMRYSTAVTVFVLYSILNGITLSVILLAFTASSVAYTFAIASITFGVMAVYGYATRTDLTRVGNLLFMGLIGLIVMSLVNLFMHSSTLEWLISLVGLFVFLGLTAYDTQRIKQYYYAAGGNYELSRKVAISGALKLYLDFINLFLILLRFFGKRR